MAIRPELPASNPVCEHDWQLDLLRHVYVCQRCDYTLAMIEIMEPHEGDGRDEFDDAYFKFGARYPGQ